MYMIGGIFFQKWYIKENGVRPWGRALRVFSHDVTAAMLVCIGAGHVSENTQYNFVKGPLASPAMNAISPVAVRNQLGFKP